MSARVRFVIFAATSSGSTLSGVEHEHDRIGAVGDPDGARYAEVRGGLLLERPEVGAADELPAFENLAEPGLELRDQRRILRLDVNERNLLRHGVGQL
jgi:hypothetical protein